MTIIFVLWLAVHIVLFLKFGVRYLYDAVDYIRDADLLIAHGVTDGFDRFFYLVPIGTMAIFRSIFHDSILPFIVFQCVLSGLGVLSLYASASTLFKSDLAGLFSSVVFLLWWDNLHWNVTPMTESMFCTFVLFLIYALVHFKGRTGDYLLAASLSVLLLFTRPTGILIFLGTVSFFLAFHRRMLSQNRPTSFLVFGVLLLLGYAGATFVLEQMDITAQYRSGNIITYMDVLEGTGLYDERLRVDTSSLEFAPDDKPVMYKIFFYVIHNPGTFVRTALVKTWYLMSGSRPYYSTAHNIYAIVWAFAVYSLCYAAWRGSDCLSIKIFSLVTVTATCLLIAVSALDWDNRFYIPMEPVVVLYAGGGAAILYNRFIAKRYR